MEKINFCSAMQPKSLKEFPDERCEFCADYYRAAEVDAKFERMKSEREDMKLEILDLKRSYCHELAEVKRLKELDQAYECDRLRIKYAALLAGVAWLVQKSIRALRYIPPNDLFYGILNEAIAAVDEMLSPPRSSPPPADTGRA